jgi:hypothetical protein
MWIVVPHRRRGVGHVDPRMFPSENLWTSRFRIRELGPPCLP